MCRFDPVHEVGKDSFTGRNPINALTPFTRPRYFKQGFLYATHFLTAAAHMQRDDLT